MNKKYEPKSVTLRPYAIDTKELDLQLDVLAEILYKYFCQLTKPACPQPLKKERTGDG